MNILHINCSKPFMTVHSIHFKSKKLSLKKFESKNNFTEQIFEKKESSCYISVQISRESPKRSSKRSNSIIISGISRALLRFRKT